jgi:hypothetical protein
MTVVQLTLDDCLSVDPIADLAARVGVTIHNSLGPEGGRVPCWPGEDPANMIGMLDEELRTWLQREADWLTQAAA